MNLVNFSRLPGHLTGQRKKLLRGLELNERADALTAIEGQCVP